MEMRLPPGIRLSGLSRGDQIIDAEGYFRRKAGLSGRHVSDDQFEIMKVAIYKLVSHPRRRKRRFSLLDISRYNAFTWLKPVHRAS